MFNFIVYTETCIFQICSLTHWLMTYWLIWLIKHLFSSVRFDISSQNFKKPLVDISPRTERKKLSEEFWLQKESFERFSCREFIFENSKQREAGSLKHYSGYHQHAPLKGFFLSVLNLSFRRRQSTVSMVFHALWQTRFPHRWMKGE